MAVLRWRFRHIFGEKLPDEPQVLVELLVQVLKWQCFDLSGHAQVLLDKAAFLN